MYLMFLSSPLFQSFYLQAHSLALLPLPKPPKIFFFHPFYSLLDFRHTPLSISPTLEAICMDQPSPLVLLPEVIEQLTEKRQGDCYQILIVRVLKY